MDIFKSILSNVQVRSMGKGTCRTAVCGHGSEGLQAWVQESVGMGLNESGTFASLTKESSVSG